MEPRTVDALARYAAQGASRRQLFRFALVASGGLALARHRTSAQDPCNAPFIYCDGMCVYSLTSNEHCGACHNACGDLVCIDGVCTACEEIGLGTCSNPEDGVQFCADLTHYLNCGACGNVCVNGRCVDAECAIPTIECEPGYTDCYGTCVDLQIDTWHCGTCFIACAGEVGPGESSVGVCFAGECYMSCLPNYTECDGRCLDLSSDPANCGACGNDCDGDACVDGSCEGAASPGTNDTIDETTTLPMTGSGDASRDSGQASSGQSPWIGAAALAALGWRWLARRAPSSEPGPPPPQN